MISILFSIPGWFRVLLSIIYLSIIVLLSLLPANNFPQIQLFVGADKVIHVLMYTGLSWMVCWTKQPEIKPVFYYLIALFSISWGVIMELFQLSMRLGRSFDYFDILGNTIGIILGLFIYISMRHQYNKLISS